jgi:hypothetical protein
MYLWRQLADSLELDANGIVLQKEDIQKDKMDSAVMASKYAEKTKMKIQPDPMTGSYMKSPYKQAPMQQESQEEGISQDGEDEGIEQVVKQVIPPLVNGKAEREALQM